MAYYAKQKLLGFFIIGSSAYLLVSDGWPPWFVVLLRLSGVQLEFCMCLLSHSLFEYHPCPH